MMVSESGSPSIETGVKRSRAGMNRGGGLISLSTPSRDQSALQFLLGQFFRGKSELVNGHRRGKLAVQFVA